jgi:hypothetical protein
MFDETILLNYKIKLRTCWLGRQLFLWLKNVLLITRTAKIQRFLDLTKKDVYLLVAEYCERGNYESYAAMGPPILGED